MDKLHSRPVHGMFDEGRVIGMGCPRQASVGYSQKTKTRLERSQEIL